MTITALQHLINLALIRELHSAKRLQPEIVRQRIDLLDIPIERLPRLLASFGSIFQP